ncbi:MAG: ABC transporter ATP-binding protein [Propionibacteriales bacterium]|nr:ABC transporter ATP-binding protein [Propionibacteriales bacterium]
MASTFADDRALLRVRDLTIGPSRDGQNVLVDNVSLSVGPGEIVGLVGESGSGKSTVCRAVTSLLAENLAVRSGRIELDGRDLVTMKPHAVHRLTPRGVSMVFQDPLAALNPVQRVGAQIVEAVNVRARLDRASATASAVMLLERMGFQRAGERLASYPHELSGGQRQRVVIAMALAGDPALLVADEPTSALDVTTQAQILELLADLASESGVGILLVSHDYGVVAQICSRVVVMYRGKVVEQGPTATVLADPRHPYTRALIDSVPSIGARQHRLPADTVERRRPVAGGCPYFSRCPHALKDRCGAAYVHVLRSIDSDRATACVRADLAPTRRKETDVDSAHGDG